MTVIELLGMLGAAPMNNRVLIRTEGGIEVEVEKIETFAQLTVITPADPVTTELPPDEPDPDELEVCEQRIKELETAIEEIKELCLGT